jgi:hypothetical protein
MVFGEKLRSVSEIVRKKYEPKKVPSIIIRGKF